MDIPQYPSEYTVDGRVVFKTMSIGSQGFYENAADPSLQAFVNRLLRDNVCLKMALKCLQEQIDELRKNFEERDRKEVDGKEVDGMEARKGMVDGKDDEGFVGSGTEVGE